jgi:2,4-dienoyl-CoA reductase (NADPH2)
VAIIGAGGIGFDVAEFLTHADDDDDPKLERFNDEWGIDPTYTQQARRPQAGAQRGRSPRQVWLLQRKPSKVGDGLAKTTGWIRRTLLKKRGVQMLGRGELRAHRRRRPAHRRRRQASACCRSTPSSSAPARNRAANWCKPAGSAGIPVTLIGGADVANELDAKRAIDQGTRLAASL